MSDRVSGRPSRLGLTSRIALVLGVLAVVGGPAAPVVGAAGNLTITTAYPAIVAEPGSTATFKLTLTSSSPTTVTLKSTGAPDGWTNRFLGGGSTVSSVYVSSDKAANAPDLSFTVDVPAAATAGDQAITLSATGDNGTSATLKVTVSVQSSAGGTVSLTVDNPQQGGPSSQTYTYTVTVKNDTPAQASYTWTTTSPGAGWTVTAKPSTSTSATALQVAAGSTQDLSVTITPDPNAVAGDYKSTVTVSGGGKTASTDLQVTITGSYSLSLATPDQGPLSTSANAGSEKDFQLQVSNGGTAPITAVTPTATAPTGWTVTFDPVKIDSLAPGATGAQNITAKITPSKDAIAGDYLVTVKVTGTEGNATDSVDVRVRVETPQYWWIAGVVLLLATFAGLFWVFRTYGRR